MPNDLHPLHQVRQRTQAVRMRVAQLMRFVRMRLRSHAALAAEVLFLRRQFDLYAERTSTWRRDMNVIRFTLVWLSYWCDWEPALTMVKPATFTRWRRQGWRLWFPPPAQLGRPPIPPALQALIRRMARENVTWGQQRIANELLRKLGLRVSPRTVRKYMPRDCVGGSGQRCPSQRWSTCIRNHAQGLLVSGLWADLTRSVQAWSGRISGLVLWWWSRLTASEVHGRVQMDTVFLSLLRETGSIPPAWLPDTGEVIRVDERSPPACRPPCTHDRGTTVRAASADTLDVHPVRAAVCRRNRASPHVPHTSPLRKGGLRVIAWRQAA